MTLITIILILGTTGITIYFMPTLIYGTTYQELLEIINSKELESIENILSNLGLIEETAQGDARRMLIICCVISAILLITIIAGISHLRKRKYEYYEEDEKNENKKEEK